MKPATAWPPVPPTYSIEEVLKGEEGVGVEGESSDCTGEGVTYQVTQNGFWTVGEEDEKVALASPPCLSVTAAISGQRLSDAIMK